MRHFRFQNFSKPISLAKAGLRYHVVGKFKGQPVSYDRRLLGAILAKGAGVDKDRLPLQGLQEVRG